MKNAAYCTEVSPSSCKDKEHNLHTWLPNVRELKPLKVWLVGDSSNGGKEFNKGNKVTLETPEKTL